VVLNHRTPRRPTPPTPCGLHTRRLLTSPRHPTACAGLCAPRCSGAIFCAITACPTAPSAAPDTPETPHRGGNKPPWRRRYGSLWQGRQSHRSHRSPHTHTNRRAASRRNNVTVCVSHRAWNCALRAVVAQFFAPSPRQPTACFTIFAPRGANFVINRVEVRGTKQLCTDTAPPPPCAGRHTFVIPRRIRDRIFPHCHREIIKNNNRTQKIVWNCLGIE
jgi:hypothetical protein